MQIDKDKLEWIQLDITARCQASCIECSRNINGKDLNPFIGKAVSWDMPLDVFKKAVTPSMLKNSLKKLLLNGNFGDPCIHPNFLEICEYVSEHAHNNLKFRVSTNGAMFKPEYWKKFANTIKKLDNHAVIFGIDGLNDTHHIYRRNTRYEDVITNAKSFIQEGGNASWQYIIFDHNRHQVEQAREIAKQTGFKEIFFKGGFDDGGGARNYTKATDDNSINIGEETKKNEKVSISVKSRPAYNDAKADVKKMSDQKGKSYLDTAKISCQWYDTKGMYIEYDGTVWMCCWVGDMHKTTNNKIRKEWGHIENKFGKHFHNLNYHTFDDILNHEFFTDYLPNSFNNTRDDSNAPRLNTCAKTCIWGKDFVS
tara:strand:- start:195 stop:1298 length:1104 start_codon:yes stop_codon:yes gene_type:complete